MLTFALAVFLLIITPGPGVLSTAGVGAAYGFQPGMRYVMGLFIGTNLVGLAVISGLAAIVFSVPVVRGLLMTASLAYLVYLAGRIALAGSKLAFIDARRLPGIKDGILLQIINPKAYAVNSALYSGFAFLPDNLLLETLLKLLIGNAVWFPIHLIWLFAGSALHRLDLADTTQKQINYAMAAAMMTVVLLGVSAAL
ncbi:LysE family transporter [Rhodobacteraceae bacterium]|nr:LysE family transporter [Paracoccaceae bacterium]